MTNHRGELANWIRKYQRWENICCSGLNHDPSQRCDLLLATGGSDLEDIVLHQVKIEIRSQPQIDPVEGQEEVPEMPANPPAVPPFNQAFCATVRAVIGRSAIVPTAWDEEIEAVKNAICKYSHQVMARFNLMFRMPASNYADWHKWAQEVLEKVKQCNWEEYGFKQTVLDALLYQCPNQHWKDKIMEGKMNFQEAVDYGMAKITAKEEGK